MLSSRGWRFVACWVLLGVVSGGCASPATNVRALRMYEHQHVTPALLASHLQQLTDTLQLIHLLLDGVPYEPGAAWVAELPLDRARAKRARALLPGAAGEASFVLVYVTHVRSVIPPVEQATAAPAPPAPLGSAGATSPTVRYESIRDALGHVHTLLTGRSFWRHVRGQGVTTTAVVRELLHEPIDPPSMRAAEQGRESALPRGSYGWFLGCVNRDPMRRCRDARTALEALLWIRSPWPKLQHHCPIWIA